MSTPPQRAAALEALDDLARIHRTPTRQVLPARTVGDMTNRPTPTPATPDRSGTPTLIERFRSGGIANGPRDLDTGQLASLIQTWDRRRSLATPVAWDAQPLLRRIDGGRLPFTGPLRELGWPATGRLEAWQEHGRLHVVALSDGAIARHGPTTTLDDEQRLLLPAATRTALGLSERDMVALLIDRARGVVIIEAAQRVFARAYAELYETSADAGIGEPDVGRGTPAMGGRS